MANFIVDKDFNEKSKMREVSERMMSLFKSTVPDMNITFVEGETWEYDIKLQRFKYVKEDALRMSDRKVISEILHHLAHALYTNLPKLANSPNPKNEFFRLVNVLEDIRVEEQMMQRYPGTFDNFNYKFRVQDSKISSQTEKVLEPHLQFLYMLYRRFWNGDHIVVVPEVQMAFQEAKPLLDEAYQMDDINKLIPFTRDQIRPIYERLLPKEPPQEDPKQEEDKQPQGGGGAGGKQLITLQQKLQAQQQMRDKSKNDVGMQFVLNKLEELSGQVKQQGVGEPSPEEKSDFGQDIDQTIDEKEKQEAESSCYGQDDPVLNRQFNPHEEAKKASDEYLPYRVLYKEIYPYINFFKKKLESIMTDNRFNRQGGSYRTGRLNNKKLFRRQCGSDKIFSRKIIRRHKDYAVTLLVDESGSMASSEKNKNAALGVCLLSEVLDRVGIPFEIRGFNTADRLYKPFGQKFTRDHRTKIENIIPETHSYNAGGNNDGWAVNLANHYLNRQGDENTERILIVLSDGLPAESRERVPEKERKRLPASKTHIDDFDLKFEIANAARQNTVIGIGINAHHVEEFYPQNVVCTTISELPLMLLSQLKKNIHRG